MANYTPSDRGARLWTRLTEWYGKRWTELYGETCNREWDALIKGATNEAIKLALSECRSKHTSFPPTLPDFQALVDMSSKPASKAGPSNAEKLRDYVVCNKPLTMWQISRPWTYIGEAYDSPDANAKMSLGQGVNITGVVVPADGNHVGYRVMLADMTEDRYTEPELKHHNVSAIAEMANQVWR